MFESLKGTFDKGIAAVSVKSESLVESSRVRTAITSAQKSMDAAVNALGVKCYNTWASGGLDPAALEEDCRKIQEINAEIASLKARLDQIKAEESQILGTQKKGALFCSQCGKQLDAGSRFCDECGAPVKP